MIASWRFELLIVLAVGFGPWIWVLLIPPVVIFVKRLHFNGAVGLALPGVILLTDTTNAKQVLRHELTHQKQMRSYSPLGVAALLGWHYGRGFVRHFFHYHRVPSFWQLWRENPLEKEANLAMNLDEPLPRMIFLGCNRLNK